MLFSEILASIRPEGDLFSVDVPASWTQGRTLFGGLQAALLVNAMRQKVPADIPLRSLQTSFVGPVSAGVVRVAVRVLREGKSAIHVQANTVSDEGVGCIALAVFGRARPSEIKIEPHYPVVERSADGAKPQPYMEGLTPPFIQHVEQRWSRGNWPFTGGRDAHTQIYVRYPGEPIITEALLIAFADTIPSPALSTMKKFAVASSMSWTLEFLVDDLSGPAEGYWLMDAEATAARDGYIYQTATLWSPTRRAVALSRQSAVVFG